MSKIKELYEQLTATAREGREQFVLGQLLEQAEKTEALLAHVKQVRSNLTVSERTKAYAEATNTICYVSGRLAGLHDAANALGVGSLFARTVVDRRRNQQKAR